MRIAWARPVLLAVALVALAGAVVSWWIPWLGVERGECGWTCYVPLTSGTAKLSYEGLGGPAGRFVAPVGVALAIAACCLASACVAVAGRTAPRRTVLALAVSALLVSTGAMVLSIVSETGRLASDVVVFTAAGTGRSVASGGLGPGIFLTVACCVAAGIVAGAVARRPPRPAPFAAPAGD